MSYPENVIEIRKLVNFTIDGRTYQTSVRWQPAANLLLLAGLDPMVYDLREFRADRVRPVHYDSTDMVGVRRWARFVSSRGQVDGADGAEEGDADTYERRARPNP